MSLGEPNQCSRCGSYYGSHTPQCPWATYGRFEYTPNPPLTEVEIRRIVREELIRMNIVKDCSDDI